jgi:hypothetical protein
MKKRNKKGQFYLIAAVVIIGLIIGFVTIRNYSISPSVKVYDLSEELNIESEQVLEHGIINQKTIETLLQDFSRDYADYIQSDVDSLFFIFGNFEEVKLVTYKEFLSGIISVGGISEFPVEDRTAVVSDLDISSSEEGHYVIVNIVSSEGENLEYKFDLTPGENFYYILKKKEGNQEFVIDNTEKNSEISKRDRKNEK